MIIATFGPSTAWVGKTITFDDGRFVLEEVGQITAQAVVGYDRQGHLGWAYDGLREWAYELAGEPAPAPAVPPAAVQSPPEPVQATPPPTAPPEPVQAAAPPPPVEPPLEPVQAAAPPPPVQPSPAPVQAPPPPAVSAPAASAPAAAVAAPSAADASSQGPPPPAPAGKSRRGWFVLAGLIVLALLIGVVIAGGRLRDVLCVAFTLLAVVFVVALVIAAVKPVGFARWFGGLTPRALLITCGAVAAACFVFAGLLWWMPHYEVIGPTDKRIALDDTPEIEVLVVNRGLLGGTYSAAYSVDGDEQDTVAFPLGGGDGRELTLSLPSGVERGDVLLSLGGASVEARAVTPPTFSVAPLQIDPSPAKLGDDVVLTTSVKNSGDIGGTFAGSLLVDGEELMAQPVEIAPGQTKDVSYDLTADAQGQYQFELGDAASEFVIVKPVRLTNGYVVKRSATGGRAYMTVTNKTGADAIAVLTRSSNKHKPVLAVYVRDGKKAKIKGIPDGAYVLWDCCGEGFNWTMRDFYTITEYKRWLQPLHFNTTASTNSWTDYWSDSYYNYSQKHSQTTTHWTNWKVTLGTGESKYTKLVTESGFPQL